MRFPTAAAAALAGTTALTLPLAAPAHAERLPNTVSAHEKALLAPVAGGREPRGQVRAVRREIRQDRAARRTLRLARRAARATDDRVPRGLRVRLARDTAAQLAGRRRSLRAQIRAARSERAFASTAKPAALAAIAACESGGNYATNTGNGYFGAYQFDLATWQSVGGSGLPSNASPAEQDARAAALYARAGAAPWPVCGR